MLRILTTMIICSAVIWGYSDLDMDGVEDSVDRCPNTSLLELVDINGCTVKELGNPHHFDVILGASYSQINPNTQEKTDTYAASLQADYYYKDFSLQLSTAYFDSQSSLVSSSGTTDTFLGAYYQFTPLTSLNVRLGGGLLLPTFDAENNLLDYTASMSLSYLLDDFNLFGSYSYTIINDETINYTDVNNDPVSINYANTNAYNIGVGYYPTAKLYTSIAYNSSESIYDKIITGSSVERVEALNTASAYLFYTVSEEWFATASYAYGLSESASDHYMSVRLGYYF